MPSADACRYAQLVVDAASHECHSPFKRLLGHHVGADVYHAADGIGAVEQCRRPFQHLYVVYGELVNLQSVVVAPLLGFVLHPVLGHHQPVEPQPPYHGARLAAADGRGANARESFDGLHEAAAEVALQEVGSNEHIGLRGAHLHVVHRVGSYCNVGQRYVGVARRRHQHGGSNHR